MQEARVSKRLQQPVHQILKCRVSTCTNCLPGNITGPCLLRSQTLPGMNQSKSLSHWFLGNDDIQSLPCNIFPYPLLSRSSESNEEPIRGNLSSVNISWQRSLSCNSAYHAFHSYFFSSDEPSEKKLKTILEIPKC